MMAPVAFTSILLSVVAAMLLFYCLMVSGKHLGGKCNQSAGRCTRPGSRPCLRAPLLASSFACEHAEGGRAPGTVVRTTCDWFARIACPTAVHPGPRLPLPQYLGKQHGLLTPARLGLPLDDKGDQVGWGGGMQQLGGEQQLGMNGAFTNGAPTLHAGGHEEQQAPLLPGQAQPGPCTMKHRTTDHAMAATPMPRHAPLTSAVRLSLPSPPPIWQSGRATPSPAK